MNRVAFVSRTVAMLFLAGTLANALPADPWALPGWSARIHLTNFNGPSGGKLSDFPVLVRLTNVAALQSARDDGGDLTFADPNGAQLFHEIESFNPATGDLLAWVCVPAFTNRTRFYLYFSNASGSLMFQGSNTYSKLAATVPSLATNLISTNVWDPGFKLVYHFGETSGNPMDSGRYAVSPSSVGISNRPGTNGPMGKALATSFPTKNNASNAVPLVFSTNKMGTSPTSVSYSMWANYSVPGAMGVGYDEYVQLLSFYGEGSFTGVLCVRMGSNHGATMNTYGAFANMPVFTNFGNWNYLAGGGTLVNLTGTVTGTNWSMTNGVVVGKNFTPVAMSSNSRPAGYLTLGGFPNVNLYQPNGGYDEFRLSATNREAGWMVAEYSNARQPANQALGEGPEYGVTPGLLSPSTATVTNRTVTFAWCEGQYGGSLWFYTLTALSNGQPWLSTNLGTNLSLDLPMATIFGTASAQDITWWVTATTVSGAEFSSPTNLFRSFLTMKARVQGLVSDNRGQGVSGVVVQSPVLQGSYLFTDATGRFDLGLQVVNQRIPILLTPPGRYGLSILSGQILLGETDLTVPFTLSNGVVIETAPSTWTNTPFFIGGTRERYQVLLPFTWEDLRRVQVYACPLSGGRKVLLHDGIAGPGDRTVQIGRDILAATLSSGPCILEMRLMGMGTDESTTRISRQLFFYVR